MEEKRKTRFGRVVNDKMDKTVVVAVETPRRHPLYKKTVKRAVKYKAHDEDNKSKSGDFVRIVETRPLSKLKRWRVAEIITKSEVIDVKPEEITEEIPEVKPDVKPEVKPDVKPEVKPDVKPEVKPEVKPDVKPDVKPEELTEEIT